MMEERKFDPAFPSAVNMEPKMTFSKHQKIKVAIVMPVWAPMRHLLFQELASRAEVYLKVFFEKREIAHRPSWKPISTATYDYEIINSYHPGWLKRYRLFPYRLPFSLSRYRPDVVFVVNLTQAIFALAYTWLKHKKLILWTGESEHTLTRGTRLIRKTLYPLIDGFGCYSKETMSFINHGLAVPASKIFQIPQCVDHCHFTGNFQVRRPGDLLFPENSNKLIFLSVGQLVYRKGYDLLINAWKRVHGEIAERSILRIAATGPLASNLKKLIHRAGLTNVELVGFVDYDGLRFLYESADVFILPTREDIWGLVINEAMAASLPVLCSKYAYAKEMIVDGENGYVFDPLNIEDTISKIETMYERRSEWRAMGRRGRKVVDKEYSVEAAATAMVEGVERVF